MSTTNKIKKILKKKLENVENAFKNYVLESISSLSKKIGIPLNNKETLVISMIRESKRKKKLFIEIVYAEKKRIKRLFVDISVFGNQKSASFSNSFIDIHGKIFDFGVYYKSCGKNKLNLVKRRIDYRPKHLDMTKFTGQFIGFDSYISLVYDDVIVIENHNINSKRPIIYNKIEIPLFGTIYPPNLILNKYMGVNGFSVGSIHFENLSAEQFEQFEQVVPICFKSIIKECEEFDTGDHRTIFPVFKKDQPVSELVLKDRSILPQNPAGIKLL